VPRVLILGLDGCGADFLARVFARGGMPFLADRARAGAWGPVASTLPPVSTAAWTTISTGVGPGTHGIVDFRRRDLPDYAFVAPGRLVSSGDVRAPRLWDRAGRAGLSSFILNLPVTFPATPLRGAMVTGVLTPPGSERGFWPPALATELKGYRYDLDEPIPGELPSLCGGLGDLEEERAQVAAAAFGRDRYDLGFICFTGPDRLFHRYYREVYAVDELPAAAAAYFRRLDACCERVYEAFGPGDANLIVCADHGFGPGASRVFHVNRFLRRAGLLRAGGGGAYALNVVLGGVRRLLGGGAPLGIDWRRTRAYGFPLYERWGGVALNVAGEQPRGTVPAADAAAAAEEVIAMLRREEACRWVRPREDVYAGSLLGTLPHVIFELAAGYTISEGKGPGAVVAPFANPLKAGDHSLTAAGMAVGPGVGGWPADAGVADVAATAAAWLGLPREGMEGRSWVTA
jgi:predicted AlkP superfamily phosphohydrolase/phosphomutase